MRERAIANSKRRALLFMRDKSIFNARQGAIEYCCGSLLDELMTAAKSESCEAYVSIIFRDGADVRIAVLIDEKE